MIDSISTRIAVLNSLLFIRDQILEDIPEIDGHGALWSTTSCVAVSCLPDCDGETDVTMGTAQEVGLNGIPLFDGRLETPSRSVVVETVLGQIVLEKRVPSTDTRIRVWTNGHRATDSVIIGLD